MKFKRNKMHYVFEAIVYLVVILAFIHGILMLNLTDSFKSKFFEGNANTTNETNLNSDELDIIQNTRNTVWCSDESPPNSTSINKTFTQIEINGSWFPEREVCFWECNKGFVNVNNSCVDLNECSLGNLCSGDDICKNIKMGYVCVSPRNDSELYYLKYCKNQENVTICHLNNKSINDAFLKIHETYPASNLGKEIVYPFLDEGSVDYAKDMLSNNYFVSSRFSSAYIENITWQEDPFHEKYWRFLFYSLRPTRHLLFAWDKTGDELYSDKLKDILISFNDYGMESEYTWDLHGSAFRTMVLVNSWWKLREKNMLDEETSVKILNSLYEHGEFLVQEDNYEPEHNHGINEAAALYLLAINFPDMPQADYWHNVSLRRLSVGMDELIDNDGVLVENSPYYHFYTLKLYWNIYHYSKEHNEPISDLFEHKIKKMIDYGTYIIQPNLEIPTVGASIKGRVNNKKEYGEIAQENPYFEYVVTRGESGIEPIHKSVHFNVTGQTIMRSGWESGEEFENQTFLVFDVGPYRTKHSDLDALSFHLYSNGRELLPDSGLYTYEEGMFKDYFYGTASHNTVVVDGASQMEGRVVGNLFVDDENFTYQSGKHFLYKGVTHKRAIMLLEKDFIVIIDRLISDSWHNYSQVFHFHPDLDIEIKDADNLTVRGIDATLNKTFFNIYQFGIAKENIVLENTIAQSLPYRGWCSFSYKIALPCHYVSYDQFGESVDYFTVITLGDDNGESEPQVNILENSEEKIIFNVDYKNKHYDVNISNFVKNYEAISVGVSELSLEEEI